MAFDPLDGSSIAPANFAIGSIFGIWPGCSLIGRTGKEQVAAAYAVYGPRTIIILAQEDQTHGTYAPLTLLFISSVWLIPDAAACCTTRALQMLSIAHLQGCSRLFIQMPGAAYVCSMCDCACGQSAATDAASTIFMGQSGRRLREKW